jgi:rod shape-determining protein MreD
MSKPATTLLVVLSSLVPAMTLRILPLPREWQLANPDWVLLFLIYWSMALPDRVGVVSAWFIGLLTDVLTGRMLGQHALAYAVITYCSLRLHRQVRLYPLYQQALIVLLFQLVSQTLVFWTQSIRDSQVVVENLWRSSLCGAVLWPFIFVGLRRLRRHFNIF